LRETADQDGSAGAKITLEKCDFQCNEKQTFIFKRGHKLVNLFSKSFYTIKQKQDYNQKYCFLALES